MAWRAAAPPGEAREDWRILRVAGEALGLRLPFDSIAALRAAMALPGFARAGCDDPTGPAGGALADAPFTHAIAQYHLADVIARASEVMARCAETYAPPALAAE
jgi:NADH-quinone oxidoreductase subunit G